MLVKICGLTRRVDAELAVLRGATHLGCVLVDGSPRCVTASRVTRILSGHPPSVRTVLVFRDRSVDRIVRDAEQAGVRTVQLHRYREEDATWLEERGLIVHRVVEVNGALPHLSASAGRVVHLDVGGGGSGRRFDWSLLGGAAPPFAFIAGGIRPENVRELLRFRPFGIDVGSGVERWPGIKDGGLLDALFEEIEETMP